MSDLNGLRGFILRHEAEAVVLARDEMHAKQIMEYETDWLTMDAQHWNIDAVPFSYIPARWNEDCLVYHDVAGEDISVKEAWKHCNPPDDPKQMKFAFMEGDS